MLYIHPQPAAMCKQHGISHVELERMVMASAKFTHLWANRRYCGWVFDVDMEDPVHVYTMGLLKLPTNQKPPYEKP